MATIKKDFADYISANKSKLDANKFKALDQSTINSLYNEWKQTGTLPKSYLKQTTPVKQNVVSDTKINNTSTYTQPVNTTSTSSASYTTPTNTSTTSTTINTPPTTPAKNIDTNTLGQVSEDNKMMVSKLESTADAFGKKQIEAGKQSEEVLRKGGEEQAKIITDMNKGARERYDAQQKQLDENKGRAYSADEERRRQASAVVDRQEGIASRQANIAAARAAQGGVQVSEAQMQDMKDDIIAKYGENVANAEQFALQTNITLDQALTNLDSTIFKDKQAIDNFVNKLDESEKAPILNAIAEATKGNVQAINDAKDFVNAILTQKATDETGRVMEFERLEDNQRRWVGMDQRQKGDFLADDMKENKWVMDAYWANPEKYANMSYGEALSTLNKIVNNISTLNNSQALMQYMLNKANAEAAGKPFTKDPAFEKTLIEAYTGVDQTNRTAEEKTEARAGTGDDTSNLTTSSKTVENASIPTQNASNTNIGISQSNIDALNKAVSVSGKAKTLEALKKGLEQKKYNQATYNKYVSYVNSK